jgi:hypothetical protein
MRPQRERLDPGLLDEEDPFEIDFGNHPHLVKHGYALDDLYDVWVSDPLVYPAADDGEADWLLVARVPGDVLCAPIAPASSGDHRKCRPIGLYRASVNLATMYEQDIDR